MAEGDARSLTQDAQQALRVWAVRLVVTDGWSQVDAAHAVGVGERQMRRWMVRYRRGGWAALEKRRRGRSSQQQMTLTGAQQARLVEQVKTRHPDQLRIPGLLWTRSAVCELIERECGVRLELSTVGRYLRRWGFTLKRPVKRALEQDPVVVEAWLAEVYPKIKARAKAHGGLILWQDESGVRLQQLTPKAGYAPKGVRAVAAVSGKRVSQNMISAIANGGELSFVDLRGLVLADLDALLTALYVRVDDLLPKRTGPGRPPRITDAELVALAVAQMFLGVPNDRKFLALARWRLAHLFPYLPRQPGYNKRLRALAPTIGRVITDLAMQSPSFCDGLRLLDSTPVPCGQSRETVKRSELAGHAGYGWCASHSRHFWGFRLYLLCAADGMPIAFELAPANAPEREVAAEMLARINLEGYTVIADKGFAGEDFETHMAALGARFLRPDRRNEPRRNGSLGPVRQWIESVFWTCKDQLTLERHGGRTLVGVCVRVALRLLALAAGLVHNQHIGDPGRHFTAYGH